MTKVTIKKNEWGKKDVIVTDDNLSSAEKLKVKYSIYKMINESYKSLMNHLPKEK
jgi:hypothetical protein